MNVRNDAPGSAIRILVVFALLGAACGTAHAQAQSTAPVPPQYRRLFAYYVDHRSMLEKSLNVIGLTNKDVGRSFTLIAGVSHYPRLPAGERELLAAEADKENLVRYLKNEEFFDEIVVLWDEDMNEANLSYFLHDYFPGRLHAFPKSRFLFAYSGHGFMDGKEGYLLGNSATSFADKKSAIDLRNLRGMVDDVVHAGYHVLVLLNSCYAGAFLTHTSFGSVYIPRHPGAHAITAGATQEKAWADRRIGRGSVFFEKLLTGLGGAADRIPEGGDGIITTSELYAYLRQEVEVSTDQSQNPQIGDLSVEQSEGEFFFLNRGRQVAKKLVPEWNPVVETPLGTGRPQQGAVAETTATESPLRTVSGLIALDGKTMEMGISGSFGDKTIEQNGGDLRLELSLSSANARYERIELRTATVTQKFTGTFSPRFGAPQIPIELSVTFYATVGTTRPSPELPMLPISTGEFRLSPFYSSTCGFACYYLEILGTWTARAPETQTFGTIRSTFQERGFAADTTAVIDPSAFPASVKLKGFAWHANSSGVQIPDLVNETVDGIPLRVSVTYTDFPGTRGADALLEAGPIPPNRPESSGASTPPQPPQSSNSENHGTTDTVAGTAQRHGANDQTNASARRGTAESTPPPAPSTVVTPPVATTQDQAQAVGAPPHIIPEDPVKAVQTVDRMRHSLTQILGKKDTITFLISWPDDDVTNLAFISSLLGEACRITPRQCWFTQQGSPGDLDRPPVKGSGRRGITIHGPDARALATALGEWFTTYSTSSFPSELNGYKEPETKEIIWVEIGPGSPWKPSSQTSPPQAAQSPPPTTFLDRVVQENRGLTPDDRNRFSTELYECDQFIKQSQAVGYKLDAEFGKLSNDRQSGALAKNVDDHIKFLRDLDTSAWDQYHGLQHLQEKWQYFPDQTEYVFSDNPFNAGEGLLLNAVEGMANSLTSWSKISNRDQQEILNIEAQQQVGFETNLRQFFDWANGTLQRIKQMRQSLDPNGVVQPIPPNRGAPAPAMFSSN
jgi:hypothetical protein